MSTRKDSKGRVLRHGESERKDGRYYYQYYDLNKIRRRVYATSLKELREKEDTILVYNIKGIDVYASQRISLNEYFDRYIHTKANLKDSTRNNYIYMYDKYIRNAIGKMPIGRIKYSTLKDFFMSFFSSGQFKMNSLEGLHTVLHPVFTMAVRDEIIHINPASHLMKEIKKCANYEKNSRQPLSKEEQKAFIQYVQKSPIYCRWLPLFTVFLGTGMRSGEVLGLTQKDIDFEKRIISVNHSLLYRVGNDGKAGYTIQTPKTKSSIRLIPMIDDVYDALQEELQLRDKKKFKEPKIDGFSGFIFLNRDHRVLNFSSVNRAIARIIKAYNQEEDECAKQENREAKFLPSFSKHHFRHTFCTRFCEVESNLKVIQEIMGHSDIETTMNVYAKATKELKQESMDKLNKINFVTIE